jgi:hypothetical protein
MPSITWSSAEHFFATALHDIVVEGRVIASHNAQIQAVGVKVEEVTAAVAMFYPPALGALEIERVSMFGIGVLCKLIMVHETPDKAAAATGLPIDLLTQTAALLQQYPQLIPQAASMFGGGNGPANKG